MSCGQKNKTKQNTHQATNQARQVSATSGVSTPGAWAGTRQGPTAPPAPPGPGTARWRPSVGSWILHLLYLPDGQKCCWVPSPHTLALYLSPVPPVYEAQTPPAPPLTLLEGRGRLRSPALAAAERTDWPSLFSGTWKSASLRSPSGDRLTPLLAGSSPSLLPTTWAVLQLFPLPASPSFTASP